MKGAIMKTATILVAVFSIPVIAFSATIYVPDDYSTIQGAIDVSTNGDTIIVRSGTYGENIDFIGKAITVTSDQGPNVTVIAGNSNGSVVTFETGEGSTTVLDGFTITNGYAYLDGGGGICCLKSSPTIKNNCITGNSASDHGGGIYCENGSPIIENNTITGNIANYGSGIDCQDAYYPASYPIISNNIITGNDGHHRGGGIHCQDYSSPTIQDNFIMGNTTSYDGGGIACYEASATIINNTITENDAKFGGSGIYCEDSSSTIKNNMITGNLYSQDGCGIHCVDCYLIIEDNIITRNSAMYGGGIGCRKGSPTIKNNIIAGNTAYGGGGIYMIQSSPNITNCIISENTTIDNKGGGIYGLASFSAITLCTITGNTAAKEGGGIYCGYTSSMTVTNTVLWDNSAATGPELWVGYTGSSSTLSISYSDVQGGQPSVYVDPGSTLNWGSGMIDVDPLFVQGPIGFYYLSQLAAGQVANSPCVDTGSNQASNLGMSNYWTRTDKATDEGQVDLGYHYGEFKYPSMQTDVYEIPAASGGIANFILNATVANASRNYLIVGGVTGTEPGTLLPGGLVTLPVNIDIFTEVIVFRYLNTSLFLNFMGKLDANGHSAAQLNAPPIPGIAGIKMHYAYCCNNPFDFVSNPVEIEIVP